MCPYGNCVDVFCIAFSIYSLLVKEKQTCLLLLLLVLTNVYPFEWSCLLQP